MTIGEEIKNLRQEDTYPYEIEDIKNPGHQITVQHVPEGCFQHLDYALTAYVRSKLRELGEEIKKEGSLVIYGYDTDHPITS